MKQTVHAIDCDMDEDCVCGAGNDSEAVVTSDMAAIREALAVFKNQDRYFLKRGKHEKAKWERLESEGYVSLHLDDEDDEYAKLEPKGERALRADPKVKIVRGRRAR